MFLINMNKLEKAIKDLKSGKPVLIYDWPGREEEVDMIYYAEFMDPSKVYKLRTEAGGMICFGTNENIAKILGLLRFTDILKSYEQLKPLIKKPAYNDISPFSIWVDSNDVRTGISDEDRTKTILKLHKVVSLIYDNKIEEGRKLFYEGFFAPGHVPLLIAYDVKLRRGHTELAILLTYLAGLKPSIVYAEMLDYGISMSLEKAEQYAKEHDLTLLYGEELLRVYGGSQK